MNYTKLFFQILFFNYALIITINCSDNRQTRFNAYKQAISKYNSLSLEEDRLYTSEGENAMIQVQQCLRDILQNNDASMCSQKLKNIMQIQSSTDNLLNTTQLNHIAQQLKTAYKNNKS